MKKLALPLPILSDVDRDQAITPLGFADEKDPRLISRPGVVIVSPAGEIVYRFLGRDYADRPDEDDLLSELQSLGLAPTTQDSPELGRAAPGEKAVSVEGLSHYFRGGKFATLAFRRRYRDLSDEFKDDTKSYIAMVERYIEALSSVEERKA